MQDFIQTNLICSFNLTGFYCSLVICSAIIGSGSFGHFHNYWLLAMTCFSFDKAAAYGGHWWRTVGRGGGGQEMTKTVKLKRFYCHGQISALGTNSSKLVEIRMMTPKNH